MIMNKKLQINVVTLLLLCLGLCITSFAIAYVTISFEVKENFFQTGVIDIDLNGNKPIIGGDEEDKDLLFEPGMTIKKEFYIENKGSGDVFYKLYFEGIKGKLGDVLEITIYKKDSPETVLFNKEKISDLVDTDRLEIAGELKRGQKQEWYAEFHFPEGRDDNKYKGESLEFKMSAIAVQTRNNDSDPENPKFK